MTEFSLPALQQDSFSTYYGEQIDRSDDGVETVVYPGNKLTASTKSRHLKKHISPKNVFITKIEYKDGRPTEFAHKLYGNDNQWATLPKRLYSVCFPKIHLGSIPTNNRITLQLTDSIHQELPYVPDEFYKQKQQKAHRPTKPVTRRNKRQRVSLTTTNESENYSGWGVYGVETPSENTLSKEILFNQLRCIMDELDKKDTGVKNPFTDMESILSNEEKLSTFTSVVQFVYHYARPELRMQQMGNEILQVCHKSHLKFVA